MFSLHSMSTYPPTPSSEHGILIWIGIMNSHIYSKYTHIYLDRMMRILLFLPYFLFFHFIDYSLFFLTLTFYRLIFSWLSYFRCTRFVCWLPADSYRLIETKRNPSSKSMDPLLYQPSPQKSFKPNTGSNLLPKAQQQQQPMLVHFNKNDLESIANAAHDISTKQHLIQISNPSPQHHPFVPLLPTAVMAAPIASNASTTDMGGIHGILAASVILDPSVSVSTSNNIAPIVSTSDINSGVTTAAATSTAYFPIGHLQYQPGTMVSLGTPHNILFQKPINAKYHLSKQQLLPNQPGNNDQSHVMHFMTTSDKNNQQLPVQYNTATVHGL